MNRLEVYSRAKTKPNFSDKIADVVANAAAHVKGLGGTYVTDNGVELTYSQLHKAEMLWSEAVRNAGGAEIVAGDNGQKIRYSKVMSFDEQVDKTLDGTLEPTNAVYVRDTTNRLKAVGMEALPMLITQKHIKSIHSTSGNKYGHSHGLDVETIKQLPQLLDEPVMIFDSLTRNDSVCMIVDALDGNRNPILVAIRPNGKGTVNNVEIDSNFITSMYGKEGFGRFINEVIKNDKLLFISKEKSQRLFDEIGLQSPQPPNSNVDFDTIIHQSRNIVKGFDEKNFDIRKSLNSDSDQESVNTDKSEREAELNTIIDRGKEMLKNRPPLAPFPVSEDEKKIYKDMNAAQKELKALERTRGNEQQTSQLDESVEPQQTEQNMTESKPANTTAQKSTINSLIDTYYDNDTNSGGFKNIRCVHRLTDRAITSCRLMRTEWQYTIEMMQRV